MQPQPDNSKTVTPLGRKGTETRARLLAATRELLKTVSPFNLTVAAIAKAARTAPATLYVYFDDVQDVFYALSVEACEDFEKITRENPDWFSCDERVAQDAVEFVDKFNSVWDRHAHALQYRNLESDRGNNRFQDLRTANAMPMIDRLANAIKRAKPGVSTRSAYADAVVLFSSVERLAATRHLFPSNPAYIPAEDLSKAQARVIASYLLGDTARNQ